MNFKFIFQLVKTLYSQGLRTISNSIVFQHIQRLKVLLKFAYRKDSYYYNNNWLARALPENIAQGQSNDQACEAVTKRSWKKSETVVAERISKRTNQGTKKKQKYYEILLNVRDNNFKIITRIFVHLKTKSFL